MDDKLQEQKPKNSKKWIWIIGGIIVLVIIFASIGGEEDTNNKTPAATTNTSIALVNNANTQVDTAGTLLDYEIIEEYDYSNEDCELIEINITVPDDASQVDIDYTLEAIIDEYSLMWDDVTVWVDNTGDMDERTSCD